MRNDRGEVAPSAVTGDRDPVSVGAEAIGVCRGPLRSGETHVHCGGEFVLRRQGIADRDDDGGSAVGEATAQAVMGIEITDNEPAPMEEHHHRQWRHAGRCIDADRDLVAGQREDTFLDRGDRFRLTEHGDLASQSLARLLGCEGM
jgi:hypothetical protein